MDDVLLDLTETDDDDDLDITKAVKKNLGHEDYIDSDNALQSPNCPWSLD